MPETILLNQLENIPSKTKKRRKRTVARRRTTKPKVIRVTRRKPMQSIAKSVALGAVGVIGAGVVSKAIPSQQKYLVTAGLAALLAIFGKKTLGQATAPIVTGMGITALTGFLATRPELAGVLSDYIPCTQLPRLPASRFPMADYYSQNIIPGMKEKDINFSDLNV